MLISKADLSRYVTLNPSYAIVDTREYGTVLLHTFAHDRKRIEPQFGVRVMSHADIEQCWNCNIGMLRKNEYPTMTRRNNSTMTLTTWAWKYVAGTRVPVCAECYSTLKDSDIGALGL